MSQTSHIGSVIGEVVSAVIGEMMEGEVVGRAPARHALAHHRPMLAIPRKPAWRKEVADLPTGVYSPGEGHEPLPMVPLTNGGVFTTSVTNIQFQARPQRPFQGTRLLAQVLRNGTSATGLAARTSGIFIGTSIQQLQIGNYNLEFFAQTAFGVGMTMRPAAAGSDVNMFVFLSGGLTDTDTVTVELLILGNSIQ